MGEIVNEKVRLDTGGGETARGRLEKVPYGPPFLGYVLKYFQEGVPKKKKCRDYLNL